MLLLIIYKGKIKTKMLGKTRMVHGARAIKEWEKNIDPKASAKGRKPKNKKTVGKHKRQETLGVLICR